MGRDSRNDRERESERGRNNSHSLMNAQLGFEAKRTRGVWVFAWLLGYFVLQRITALYRACDMADEWLGVRDVLPVLFLHVELSTPSTAYITSGEGRMRGRVGNPCSSLSSHRTDQDNQEECEKEREMKHGDTDENNQMRALRTRMLF